MAQKQYFEFIPALGRKTNVAQNDPSLFRMFGESILASHDVGGVNFDIQRLQHACSKALGDALWSSSVVSTSTTETQGLFELYDSSANRNKIIMNNGKFFVYDTNKDPGQKQPLYISYDAGGGTGLDSAVVPDPAAGDLIQYSTATGVVARFEDYGGDWGTDTAGTGNIWLSESTGSWHDNQALDLVNGTTTYTGALTLDGTTTSPSFSTSATDHTCAIRVGDYVVFTDRGSSIPYKWKHGDTYITPLDVKGGDGSSGYKFRYLASFARRVIGAYCSNDSAPEISYRWSTDWPATAISNLYFPSTYQNFVDTDDPIVGIHNIGVDQCYIYSTRSVSELGIYRDYDATQKIRSYIALPGVGAINHQSIVNVWNYHIFPNEFYGMMKLDCAKRAEPISQDIDSDFQDVKWDKMKDYCVGRFIPYLNCAVWTMPMVSNDTPNRLLFYHTETQQWFWEDKVFYFLDQWYDSDEWKLMLSGTDGHVYSYGGYATTNSAQPANLDGYRIEPIMDFGNPWIPKRVTEVGFEVITGGDYTIDLSWRGGDSVKEVMAASWTSVGTLNINSPSEPFISFDQNHKLHQMKWGTNGDSEDFQVNKVRVGYYMQPRTR